MRKVGVLVRILYFLGILIIKKKGGGTVLLLFLDFFFFPERKHSWQISMNSQVCLCLETFDSNAKQHWSYC